jgi:hypothetical protein
VHYLPHQLLDHLLADEAILLARQFCDCLRDGAFFWRAHLPPCLEQKW